MSAPVTRAELDDLRRDAEFVAARVGAPGSPIRRRAAALLRLLTAYERTDYAPCVACGGAGFRSKVSLGIEVMSTCIACGGSGVAR